MAQELLSGHDIRFFMPAKQPVYGCEAKTSSEGHQYPMGVLSAVGCAVDGTLKRSQEAIKILPSSPGFDNYAGGAKGWSLQIDRLAMTAGYGQIDELEDMRLWHEPILVAITRTTNADGERASENHYNSMKGMVRTGFAIITECEENYPLRGLSTKRVTLKGCSELFHGDRLITGDIYSGPISPMLTKSLLRYGFSMCEGSLLLRDMTGSGAIIQEADTRYASWEGNSYYESAATTGGSGTIFIGDDYSIWTWDKNDGKFAKRL